MNPKIKEILEEVGAIIICPEHAEIGGVAEISFNKYVDLQKFVDEIIDKCLDVVIESDPSTKMIMHEPYKTIMDNISEYWYGDPVDCGCSSLMTVELSEDTLCYHGLDAEEELVKVLSTEIKDWSKS